MLMKEESKSLYKLQLQKARKEYKKTGQMNSERACMLLNCITTQEEFKRLNPSNLEEGLEYIKLIEKEIGIGKGQFTKKIAVCVYFITELCERDGKVYRRYTQEELCEMLKITPFKQYYSRIRKILKDKINRNKLRRYPFFSYYNHLGVCKLCHMEFRGTKTQKYCSFICIRDAKAIRSIHKYKEVY